MTKPGIFSAWRLLPMLLAAGILTTPETGRAAQGPDPSDEYIIVTGGPSLKEWEQFRREAHRHDKWWGNFVRTARIRIDQLQKYYNGAINITWLVYRPGYERRAGEDGQPLISNIESVRDKYKIRLVWFDSGDDVIKYLNSGQNRRQVKVGGFEYFGHSNKYCFTFDYSNEILGASKAFLHERDLKGIDRGVFSKKAFCKSWGCHSGESFVGAFKRATGVKMIGAVGKTDYSDTWREILPTISSQGGRWTS
ncbi:MAG: hypothetical protein H7A53_05000 [Akkermansiaceae bacterium]|nr:hypothetical protein [Akkermansiaceae bacterium]